MEMRREQRQCGIVEPKKLKNIYQKAGTSQQEKIFQEMYKGM